MNWTALEKRNILLRLQQQTYRSFLIDKSIVLDIFSYILSVHFMQNKIRCSCAHTTRKAEYIWDSSSTMIAFLTILGYHLQLTFQAKARPTLDSDILFKHGVEVDVDESIDLQTKWENIQKALVSTKEVFQDKYLEFILSGVTDFRKRRERNMHSRLASTRYAIETCMLTVQNEKNDIPNTLPVPYNDRFVNFFGQEEAETFIEFGFNVNFTQDGKRYGTFNDLMQLKKESYTSLLELSDKLKNELGTLDLD